ncbi:MAG: J domain-containing protein [Methylococcaceae bacterium]|nr:J domain-containing protein [Methylococcaceae bacterium]
MHTVRTHYDNLKVARNAPPEVIRAAYKSLSQKYHPDKNPGNADAARIAAIINTAYEILSDPDKRRKHDLWIAEQELLASQIKEVTARPRPDSLYTVAQPVGGRRYPGTSPLSNPARRPADKLAVLLKVIMHVPRNWHLYGVVGFFIWILVYDKSSLQLPEIKPYQSDPRGEHPFDSRTASSRSGNPAYTRPPAAPNGQQWPSMADYVEGYQQLHTGGLSSVTVDNSRNDSDVFVKLVSLDGATAYPVRQFYIPAFRTFTLNNVTAGSYDVRYRDLTNGRLSRSEAFNLREMPTSNGTQYSNITMTLYKVQNGNMQTYGISEAEF